jgi:hypothetical protein
MKASVGDRIVIASTTVDQPARDGRVVEVRHPDGSPPYLVEWADTGERSLVFPGPDTKVVEAEGHTAGAVAEEAGSLKRWTVQIRISEQGDDTTATAVLGVDGPQPLDAVGRTHRNPGDTPSATIGDEVAVARALRMLADRLLETAGSEISAATGHPTTITP